MRPRYTKVRARSAWVGSATAGWLLAVPEPACFPAGTEDIAAPPVAFGLGSSHDSEFLSCFGYLFLACHTLHSRSGQRKSAARAREQPNTMRLELSVQTGSAATPQAAGANVWRDAKGGIESGYGAGFLCDGCRKVARAALPRAAASLPEHLCAGP